MTAYYSLFLFLFRLRQPFYFFNIREKIAMVCRISFRIFFRKQLERFYLNFALSFDLVSSKK